jgi:hypothetical protein
MSNKFAGGIIAGSTGVSIPVVLRKTTDNTELTAQAYTAVTAFYQRQGAAPVAITPATLSLVTSAWAAGGWIEESSANVPGLYRFDPPDAAWGTGADWVTIAVIVSGAFVFYERFALSAASSGGGTVQAITQQGYGIPLNNAVQPLRFAMFLAGTTTPASGLTPTVVISKNMGAFATPAGAVAEIPTSSGTYAIAANATDANTRGQLELIATASGADPVKILFQVGPVRVSG